MPKNFPSWRTCRRRLIEWEEQGVLIAVHQHRIALLDEQGKLRLDETFLDGTFVPAKKRGECVGKTKAGKGSMIMVASDAKGVPLNTVVASASTYEGHLAEKTIDGIQAKKHGTRHKHPKRLIPKRVVADKGYDDDKLRGRFAERGIDCIVPYRDNRVNRPFEDLRKLRRYKRRWKVERTNAWLKNFRRVTIRWDRNLSVYKGCVHIACVCITLMKF